MGIEIASEAWEASVPNSREHGRCTVTAASAIPVNSVGKIGRSGGNRKLFYSHKAL
jgi:hypothetical protein